ncbi:MAG: M20/M25/M40 family metallo-hydrolase [Synergistaceae bacterium]|nr:M20/M25/M40 family metallo-hydrolase [Synergistaceae bacterium]
MIRRERLLKMIEELVSIPSVTESDSESMPGIWIKERLEKLQYFIDRRDHLIWIETPLEGSCEKLGSLVVRVNASVPTERTILLIGHYDVVGVSVYGEMAKIAFDVKKITELLNRDNEDVIYGRGTMDMKCGLAIELDIIEEFAADRELFDVNIVAAFVGDEENASAGMRGVLPVLRKMKESGTDFLTVINTEPGEAGYSGESGPAVFLGTLGKIMPGFYVRGCASHVGNYYTGFSSALAVSRIVSYAEGNPHLADPLNGKCEPSWICLDMSVIKKSYSVTVPDRAYAYFNAFTTTYTPADVMAHMKVIAEYALDQTLAQLTDSCMSLVAIGYQGKSFYVPRGKIYTLDEIKEIACSNFAENFDEELSVYIESLPPGDMRNRGLAIVDKIADMAQIEGPYAICFFLPPWLPFRTDFTEDSRDIQTVAAVRSVKDHLVEKYGIEMKELELFAGLCDLSYVGARTEPEETNVLEKNMPGWGQIYSIPIEDMQCLGLPVINLGPSGEDAHKKTERLRLGYSLDVLPELLRYTIRKISETVK